MPTVANVLRELETIAPARLALEFDRIGLQVGDTSATVTKAIVSLDRSLAAVEFAESKCAQLLVSHHPLIFRPLDSVTESSHVGRTILRLAKSGIAFVAAHTNWDAAQGGVNDELCRLLALQDVRPFGSGATAHNIKLVFFCPASSVDAVLDAVSVAGAGEIGLYRRCAFSAHGIGTYVGGEASNPTIGERGKIEKVEELRVETVARAKDKDAIERALRAAHPYEEPAFDWYRLDGGAELALGRVGRLATPTTLGAWARGVDESLATRCAAWGDPQRPIQSVAVVGGAADDEWQAAQRAGADVLLTGEVKQHHALEATESGFALVAAGHYATEQPGARALRDRLASALPEIEWSLFEPEPGSAGRPL